MPNSKYFQGINIILFLFEENLYDSLFGNTFQGKLLSCKNHQMDCFANQLTYFYMIRFFTESCFRTDLITTTVINCKIIFLLYNLNSTNQGYELRVQHYESTKIFLQNLRYKHMQNIITPKYKLAYMRYFFSFIGQSKSIYRPSDLLPKFRHQRSKYCFSIIIIK